MSGPSPTTPLELAQHAEILELESQIRILNTKVSAAVDHAADLEDEIRSMRARHREESEAREQQQLANESASSIRRMSTYFSSRRPSVQALLRTESRSPSKSNSTGLGVVQHSHSSPTVVTTSTTFSSSAMTATRPSSASGSQQGGVTGVMNSKGEVEEELEAMAAQLRLERQSRLDLEQRYRSLQDESEVLSQSLFEEANRMVAAERKALHAATEQLAQVREREMERRRRVAALERTVESVVRVRGVLVRNNDTP